MNIILSPASEISFKEVMLYVDTFKEVIGTIYQKCPAAPRLMITIDDAACCHKYQYTGERLENGCAKAQCRKCGTVIFIHQKGKK